MSDHGDPMMVHEHTPGQRGDHQVDELLATIVRTMAEMEQGRRPVAALDPISSPLAARRIRRLVRDVRFHECTARRDRRPLTIPVQARTTASFHPSAGVTEGVVVVSTPERARAYCVRLEQEGDRWRLVELAQPDCSLQAVVTHASRTGAVYVDRAGKRRSSAREGSERRGDVDGRRDGSGAAPGGQGVPGEPDGEADDDGTGSAPALR